VPDDPIMGIKAQIPGLGIATKIAGEAASMIPVVGPMVKGAINKDFNDQPVGSPVGSDNGSPVIDATSSDVAGGAGGAAGLGDLGLAAAAL
jgi:hypothetical protein